MSQDRPKSTLLPSNAHRSCAIHRERIDAYSFDNRTTICKRCRETGIYSHCIGIDDLVSKNSAETEDRKLLSSPLGPYLAPKIRSWPRPKAATTPSTDQTTSPRSPIRSVSSPKSVPRTERCPQGAPEIASKALNEIREVIRRYLEQIHHVEETIGRLEAKDIHTTDENKSEEGEANNDQEWLSELYLSLVLCRSHLKRVEQRKAQLEWLSCLQRGQEVEDSCDRFLVGLLYVEGGLRDSYPDPPPIPTSASTVLAKSLRFVETSQTDTSSDGSSQSTTTSSTSTVDGRRSATRTAPTAAELQASLRSKKPTPSGITSSGSQSVGKTPDSNDRDTFPPKSTIGGAGGSYGRSKSAAVEIRTRMEPSRGLPKFVPKGLLEIGLRDPKLQNMCIGSVCHFSQALILSDLGSTAMGCPVTCALSSNGLFAYACNKVVRVFNFATGKANQFLVPQGEGIYLAWWNGCLYIFELGSERVMYAPSSKLFDNSSPLSIEKMSSFDILPPTTDFDTSTTEITGKIHYISKAQLVTLDFLTRNISTMRCDKRAIVIGTCGVILSRNVIPLGICNSVYLLDLTTRAKKNILTMKTPARVIVPGVDSHGGYSRYVVIDAAGQWHSPGSDEAIEQCGCVKLPPSSYPIVKVKDDAFLICKEKGRQWILQRIIVK